MYIFTGRQLAKRHRRYVIGGGLFDWIGSVTSTLPSTVARAIGSAGNFLSANKDTISNVASVIGNVANAGATTASAVKQIYDIVKAKRAATAAAKKLPKLIEQKLSQKSVDYLQQLARAEQTAQYPDINSRIAGAGFKTLKRGSKGKGLILGPNSPFKDIPLLGAIL